MGRVKRAAGAARASACVGTASCIQAYEPVVDQLDTVADRSRARKACHVDPGRRRVAVWVLTQEDTRMLRYMRVQIRAQVALKSIEDVGVESARGARPLALKWIAR